jgi:hypothetical protein
MKAVLRAAGGAVALSCTHAVLLCCCSAAVLLQCAWHPLHMCSTCITLQHAHSMVQKHKHASLIEKYPSLPELMSAVYGSSSALDVLEFVFELPSL